jgi:hypothetical protein
LNEVWAFDVLLMRAFMLAAFSVMMNGEQTPTASMHQQAATGL